MFYKIPCPYCGTNLGSDMPPGWLERHPTGAPVIKAHIRYRRRNHNDHHPGELKK